MTSDLRAQLQAALGNSYTVERELGGGGMSRVFVATELTLGRKVVVKVLPPELAAEVSMERFRREIQVAAQLQNPHIVPLLTAGEGQGLLYYTMPFVEGETLRARLERGGELPLGSAVQVLRNVTKALAYAHRRGVVHRDIKPENILLSDGDALVADFGVAKALSASATNEHRALTSVGMALGTPAYMAPEQAAGDTSADARADLYALGVMAYEMLTGSALFPGRSPQAQLAAHTTEMPEAIERRRPGLPEPLTALVMSLLAKRPADRPQTADDVLRTLDDMAISSGTGLRVAQPGPSRSRRPVLAGAILILMVGGLVFAFGRLRSRPARETTDADRSIAVLPFVNMSGDKENEYFSDGMTEELIDRLANLNGLHVAARTSSFAFKGKQVDVTEIGRQLHVHSVVEGSVRREGSKIRVTAQLIDADNGYHRWSHTYDGDLKDVFAVQQQIGTAIASELQLALAGHDSTVLARAPTADTLAHRLYLQAMFALNQRTAPSLVRAAALLHAAIARDSSYAQAYAALAETYSLYPFYVDDRADSAWQLAEDAARAALRLDSGLAAAHAALGNVYSGRYEWAASGREFELAIALAPSDPTPRHWYATTLATQGRFDEAERQARAAVAADPLSLVSRQDLGEVLLGAGKTDEAEAEIRHALEIEPRNAGLWAVLGSVLLTQRRGDSALAALRQNIALDSPGSDADDLAFLGYAYGVTGHRDSALAIRHRLASMAAHQAVSSTAFALMELGLGNRDRAFVYFEQAIDHHEGFMLSIFPTDPLFAPLRSDPRFKALKHRAHLS